jgi:DNA (cytosine-5)-methyltransferase 1
VTATTETPICPGPCTRCGAVTRGWLCAGCDPTVEVVRPVRRRQPAEGSMTRPRLLDLFCCQGGSSMGYHRAGFDVVGLDSVAQPRFPFEFHQGDALDYLAAHGHEFDAIHASPPCHDHSALRGRTGRDHGTGWLLDATRQLLESTGKPYVIENVPGAVMAPRVILCGSMFNLGAAGRVLRRHRYFETSTYVLCPPDQCSGRRIGGVYGTGGAGQMTRGYKFTPTEAAEAMGISWMTTAGLSQAIPPAYTEFIGEALLASLTRSIGGAA